MTRSEALKRIRRFYEEALEEFVGETEDYMALDMAIEALERTQWVPCGERLPENNDTVLITHRGGMSFGWYNGLYWERGASTKHRPLQTVVAWMPLPEPYKDGER